MLLDALYPIWPNAVPSLPVNIKRGSVPCIDKLPDALRFPVNDAFPTTVIALEPDINPVLFRPAAVTEPVAAIVLLKLAAPAWIEVPEPETLPLISKAPSTRVKRSVSQSRSQAVT